jgi:protein-tyrosine phosphatase
MKQRVLFVCLGNICRSPLAHALAKTWIEERGLEASLEVDSCGTSSYHIGDQADSNTRATARGHGVDMEWHRSRQLVERDYTAFDVLVAMDAANESVMHRRSPRGATCRIVRFMDYVPDAPTRDVPDPYYDGGFERVHGLVESGVGPLLEEILEINRASSE